MVERLFIRRYYLPSIPTHSLSDQFGFRPTGSTTTALIYIFHNVTQLLADNNYVRCLLLDFSKAFDTVSHSVLLDELVSNGSPQHVINWLANYLSCLLYTSDAADE